MAGPTLSIGLDPDILLRCGDSKAAAEGATRAIKEMEKEAAKADKEGRQLDDSFKQRLKKMEQVQKVAKETIARSAEAERVAKNNEIIRSKDESNAEHFAYNTHKAMDSLRRALGDQLVFKMLNGQAITGQDVVRHVVNSERLAEKAGRMVGLDPSTINQWHPVIAVVTESVFKLMELNENAKRDKEYMTLITQDVYKKLVGENVGALYETGNETTPLNYIRRFMGVDVGKEKVEKNRESAEVLREISEKGIQSAYRTMSKSFFEHPDPDGTFKILAGQFGPADWLARMWFVYSKTSAEEMKKYQETGQLPAWFAVKDSHGKKLTPGDLTRGLNGALEAERMRLHTASLSNDQTNRVLENFVATLTISDALRAELKKSLNEELRDRQKPQDVNREYHKFHADRMYHAQFEVYQRRVPANPTD